MIPPGYKNDDVLAAIAHERNLRAVKSLHAFIRYGWQHAGLPGRFVDGWHIRLLCKRLEEITWSGQGRQIWASPPRSTKSTVYGVFWPAWTWLQPNLMTEGGPLAGSWVQFLCITHRDDLASRDSKRCRQLIRSDWYQGLHPGREDLAIKRDSDQSSYFALGGGGHRRAFGIRASVTGHDSDVQIVDDPFDVEKVLRAAEREHVEFVWDEALPNRFNHPTRNAVIMGAQRTHVSDLHAHVFASADWRKGRWRYDCIQGVAEADPDPHVPEEDTRAPGEVYWPERYTVETLNDLTKTAHARAAQIQQTPQVRGGGIFRNAQWKIADEAPVGIRWVRYWDKAATAEGDGTDPDYTAGAKGGFDAQGRFWLVDMQHGRWSSRQVEERIQFVARELDDVNTPIYLEEEPGSSGKDVTSHYQRTVLRGYSVRGDRPTGNKLVRVDPFLAACEAGNVIIVRPPGYRAGDPSWHHAFVDECDQFTGGDATHDDQVIAAVGAFKCAAQPHRVGTIALHGV